MAAIEPLDAIPAPELIRLNQPRLECSQCGKTKAESDMVPARGSGLVKRKRRCKDCKKAGWQEWADKNPDYWTRRDPEKHRQRSRDDWNKNGIKRKYGITLDQLEEQKYAQANACAICKEEIELHIDHDHATGQVRGLLCGKHNRGLGMFDDNPELLRAAIAYLEGGGSWLPSNR